MSTRPDRETAYRVFAAEFEDANYSYAESDEERAPNYVVMPTGVRTNRVFAVGVLTEIETVGGEQLRARIVDPTGAFVVYAGQYQPEALSFLEAATPPAFVAVTGKARTFRPEDSDRVFTSVRPETMSEVDAETRDRFTVDTAQRTVDRIAVMRDALAQDERGDDLRVALEDEGVEGGLAAGIPHAISQYGLTPAYLDAIERTALDAARVVAGEREEVRPIGIAPGEGGESEVSERAPMDTKEPTAEESAAPTPAPGSAAETGTNADAETADGKSSDGTETTADTIPDSVGEPDASDRTDEPRDEAVTESDGPVDSDDGTDPGSDGAETEPSGTEPETDDFDAEEFELDAEVREQIEDTYGTDFETAGEVGDPGEADIETPTPDPEAGGSVDVAEDVGGDEPDTSGASEDEPGTEAAEADSDDETPPDEPTAPDETDKPSAEPGEDTEGDSDVDPETAVLDVMTALDDGDGAERAAIEERAADEYGFNPEKVDEGIQAALMSGECYESGDDTFTPI